MNPHGKKLTKKGFDKISAEYLELSKIERPKVVRGVTEAAAEGDRSENAEYIYGKKRLREIDKRLQYLAKLLKDVKVVNPEVLSSDSVLFGATVELVDEENNVQKYQIVGDGEADYKAGTISYLSPFGQALLGKKVGDVVEVHRPKGRLEVEVVAITFV